MRDTCKRVIVFGYVYLKQLRRMPAFQVNLLGGFETSVKGYGTVALPTCKARALVAFLAVPAIYSSETV